MPFLTICLNPTLQKTLFFPSIVPGEVNRTGVHRLDASGKGINVTRVLTQLGKKAVHLTQLGGELRPLFLSLCKSDSLSVEWAESESQIRFCYTIITENDGNVTELVEESQPVRVNTEKLLTQKFDSLLETNQFSFLIISGTKAAGFSGTLIPSMVQKAKERKLKVILDVKGDDLINSLQYKPDVIKPNLLEFAGTFSLGETSIEQIKNKMSDISHNYETGVILTDGSRKLRVVYDTSYFEIEIQPAKAVNTIGCGDAFTAGLASALEDGAHFREAIAEGMRCGALNAALVKPGVIC